MTDALSKVRPGQPLRIPAAAYNAFVDAAKASRGNRQDINREAQREQARFLTPIKNDSDATIPRFGVLGVDGPLFSPSDNINSFKRRVALIGSTPSAETHFGKFAIAMEPIAPGAIGMSCAFGLCIAKVDFPDEGRERLFADIDDGSSDNLKASDRGAATIIWSEEGAGVKWAVVRIGGGSDSYLFPVALSQVGGEQGTDAGPATWTYQVLNIDDDTDELAPEVDPVAEPSLWRRPATGAVERADAGLAFYDTSGELALVWINEVFAGGSGDFQAFFVHKRRLDGVEQSDTDVVVGQPGQITYDIKADPDGLTAEFTNVAPTSARETVANGALVAANEGAVCMAKIGLDSTQNPIIEALFIPESEPQRLLVASDDEPGFPVVSPWAQSAGGPIKEPLRLETVTNQDSVTLKLIVREAVAALKSSLPNAASQNPTDPFSNKLNLAFAISPSEIELSSVEIPTSGGGITDVRTQLITNLSASGFGFIVTLGEFHAGPTIIDPVSAELRTETKKIRMGVRIQSGTAFIGIEVNDGSSVSVPLTVED